MAATNVVVLRAMLEARIVRTVVLVDVDECQLSDFYCGEKGVCRNLVGSYECECAEGFQRDQYTGQCVDIDECK
ncbi:unnamed protein product [Gongylonema pulchrum]|uniref:EGF-like domain-containing protein n=1 Tax=Gongylonema pulchrum TaxID=637853 RepID=A0A183D0F8_9BILA|nr:unnamed protein product [Gongylonema pulchrum]